MLLNMSLQNKIDENNFINSTLFNLLMRCPLNGAPSEKCPFRDYRTGTTPEEKQSFIKGLHETSRLHLLAMHNRCAKIRQGNSLCFSQEYDVNIEKAPKSLYVKYYRVKTALEETIRRRRLEIFNEKILMGGGI
ncbi:MAG: hypothetical protein KAV87_16015 [Desulfobacteraceae bacterium]|nr:hypothetical protein [Desulfobacteraceae bacterium]